MEKLVNILPKINIPTHELRLELIQEVMIKAKEYYKAPNQNIPFWNEVSKILWVHIQNELKNIDDQLLCATCFYTVLTLTDKQDFYLTQVLEIINAEIILKKESTTDVSNTTQVVSLMYGMFQSSLLTQKREDISTVIVVLESAFHLLILMGYEYTQHTFLTFKTIKFFKKVCGTNLERTIFSENNRVVLLNLTIHNWENPITGVRDLIKDIFQTLLTTFDDIMLKSVIEEINCFYWNKAKYLMLSEIIECYSKDIVIFVSENNWIEGLIYSLHKPGLVSAGADMYYSILKKCKSEDEWHKMFLNSFIKIFNGVSKKAIENFINYWCMTTFKKFPYLINDYIDQLETLENSEQKLYGTLGIMKQGNKLGILDRNWSETVDCRIKRNILIGLEHNKAHIRMLAFDIVCVSKGKTMSSGIKYDVILEFLNNNLNSDCTVLRLAMLGSFKYFMTQLHICFLNNMSICQGLDSEKILYFCKRLQELLVDSLNLNGNYQRKITCVKLIELVLSCLSEIPKKRKDQTKRSKKSLVDILKDRGYWIMSNKNNILKLVSLLKDPADDIRANIVKLLLNHYSTQLREKNMINNLIENAFTSMRSKFFYEISCGQSILKLIVNLLLKENHPEATFQSAEDIFNVVYQEIITEYNLKRDVMKSIENGKQLHSFINILCVVLEACISISYKIKTKENTMTELLNALKDISNQFSWEQQTTTSSDFSKMNDMVQEMIIKSGYDPCNENDHTKISGLHQIVLNCLWLNVKASCDLASLMILYNTEDLMMCEKCLNLITHVLETSRHKGAIEAAGAALGRAIQYLTSLPEESSITELPYILLQSKLKQLICEASKMSSITRRGAGLSIMVHRIVSSDLKKGKRLFHYFMNTLLRTCTNAEDVPNVQDHNIENEMDLPKAIYIHFLTRVVTDSSLASDLMYYSSELAELAFNNLTSPHWQIRNAALQLYGALVPRQIGQKKPSGTDEETIATVACDELRTHSPKLWEYITEQLKNNNDNDKVQYHSNLVPVLNMLANSAKRYNFSNDITSQKASDRELLRSLVLLLSSPIYTVRRLTAKCIFNIYSIEIIYDVLINEAIVLENFLHGSLLLLGYCRHYYTEDLYEQYFNDLRRKFSNKLSDGKHAYFCKERFEYMFHTRLNINDIKNTFSELDSYVHAPGIFLWVDTRLKTYVHNCPWNDIPQVIRIVLSHNDYEKYCEFIITKIETENNIPEKVLLEIVDILLSFQDKYFSSVIWQILYQICLQTDLSNHVDVTSIIEKLNENAISYKLRYVIPLSAKVLAKADEQNQLKLSRIIYYLVDSGNADVDMRYIATLANNEIAHAFGKLGDEIKLNSIKSAVILLQDEDEDVRSLSVEFYKNLINLKIPVHPNICLHKILDFTFITNIFNEPQKAIKILCDDLSHVTLQTPNCILDEYNPFANDTKNIYLEVDVLRHLVENLNNVEF